MDKLNFVMNGGLNLPIGYRFRPTDEELIVHYLKRKVFAMPLPALVIPEFDVFHTDPCGLPGDPREKRYFFSNRKGNVNDNRCKRLAGCGYWKPIGKEKQIVTSGSNLPIGMRKTLVFCRGKRFCGIKTRWVMHEFRLVGFGTNPSSNQKSKMELEDWVVYTVFERKRRPKKRISKPSNSNETRTRDAVRPRLIDFMMEDSSDIGPPQPSSTCSSEITELSSNGLDQEESSALHF